MKVKNVTFQIEEADHNTFQDHCPKGYMYRFVRDVLHQRAEFIRNNKDKGPEIIMNHVKLTLERENKNGVS